MADWAAIPAKGRTSAILNCQSLRLPLAAPRADGLHQLFRHHGDKASIDLQVDIVSADGYKRSNNFNMTNSANTKLRMDVQNKR